MSTIQRPRCPQCGNRLRLGRQMGDMCDVCQRVEPDPRLRLPAGFYDQDLIVAALGGYDFGSFFRTVRELTEWTQQTLGGVVGLEQSQISAIERGDSQLRNIELIAGVAHGLAIPPVRLNFPDIRATVGRAGADRKRVSWVDRRDFGQHIAALTLGVVGAAGLDLDLDRLLALLPEAEPTGTRQVGAADIEVIEQLTAEYRRQDFAGGGELVCTAAVAYVHEVLPLLGAEIDPDLRPRLVLAVADLATEAGWLSFLANRHEAARRLWIIGLELARAANHPQGTDLTVYLLADMTLQAVQLGRPKEAVHLARIGDAAAVGRYPVSASTTMLLANIQAQAHAADGDAKACDRACGQAVERFSSIDPAAAPPWTAYLSEAGGNGQGGRGAAYYELARLSGDQRAAERAALLLSEAVGNYGPGYAQLQARYLPDLAGTRALTGDIDTAVTVGHQAIDLLSAQYSSRVHERLRILNTVLEPLHTSTGVVELRGRLAAIAA